jgi:hypothetical protein
MPDHTEKAQENLDAASRTCLEQTRSAVLNVLVVVGVVIAVTGFVLRGRDKGGVVPGEKRWREVLFLGLGSIFVASTVLRRALGRRARWRDPRFRSRRFFAAHVWPAVLGALAAPLGLLCGWLISPHLDAVLPFWVVAIVLGVLALPRASELEGFDTPTSPPSTGAMAS